jgi:hypothetical protein
VSEELSLLKSTEAFLRDMLSMATVDANASLTDKMKIVDRILKLEAIKAKMDSDDEGSFFNDD